MSWAATRTTTRIENEAYSLLGIFGVNMPLIYGERGRAFLRLQEEIIRRSADMSIFAWSPRIQVRRDSMIAPSPRNFQWSGPIHLSQGMKPSRYTITNNGLEMSHLLWTSTEDMHLPRTKFHLPLNCVRVSTNGARSLPLCIPLRITRDGSAHSDGTLQFMRDTSDLYLVEQRPEWHRQLYDRPFQSALIQRLVALPLATLRMMLYLRLELLQQAPQHSDQVLLAVFSRCLS